MIQFNLLPDVKLEYVRVQRTKHTVTSAAVIAASSAFLIFLLLFMAVNLVQKKSISDLNSDLKKYNSQIESTANLSKILTIQNQLGALPDLHKNKPAVSRTFTFIQQLIPSNVSLTDLTVDFTAKTISISGASNSLDQVNTLVDTLKLTKYSTDTATRQTAFTGVALSQFSRTSTGATFTVLANYDQPIFDNTHPATLNVPTTVSSSSVIDLPPATFQKAAPTTTTKTNGTTH